MVASSCRLAHGWPLDCNGSRTALSRLRTLAQRYLDPPGPAAALKRAHSLLSSPHSRRICVRPTRPICFRANISPADTRLAVVLEVLAPRNDGRRGYALGAATDRKLSGRLEVVVAEEKNVDDASQAGQPDHLLLTNPSRNQQAKHSS